MANQNAVYSNLYENWKKAYPEKKGDVVQKEVNAYWNANKTETVVVKTKTQELRKKAARRKQNSTLMKWMNEPTVTSCSSESQSVIIADTTEGTVASGLDEPTNVDDDVAVTERDDSDKDNAVNFKRRPAPAQERVSEDISRVNEEIARIQVLKENGFATTEECLTLKRKLKEKERLETQLRRIKSIAENSRKSRLNKKRRVEDLKETFPELAAEIEASCGARPGAGRPRIEEQCPLLLQTIVDIVAPEASADVGRRSELLRACTSLDDLKKELEKRLEGLSISRSGLYLRLVPRNSATTEGKRHTKTVPVKLMRAQNIKRKGHPDDHFAAAVNLFFRNLAEALGPEICFVLSQDDKARVLLGLPAASKQAPVLMHLEYRVVLPDHDYVVAPGHKLIPSVYAGLKFENRKLTYSGPTYIAIRSGKHDKSTAGSHAKDFRTLVQQESFEALAKTGAGDVKPVVFIFTDGGPDENPRFPKVLEEVARNFKLFDLDAIFVATHAPGQSAYNQVERRMAPLSRDLAGLILPHDFYGSHLNASGKTIDADLELQNFQKAGETLAEVWSSNTIDGGDVDAEYIAPGDSETELDSMEWFNEAWKANHVRQSQYCLQIVKCGDESCCKPLRSNLTEVLPSRFIPAPVLFKGSEKGPISCATPGEQGYFGSLFERKFLEGVLAYDKGNHNLPFDYYCPSVHGEIQDRVCDACQGYFVSKKALNSHKKAIHKSTAESIADSINAVVQKYSVRPVNDGITIIKDLRAWMTQDFMEVDE